ncbi:MAG: RNA polymerase sigma factor [Clostridia bacterium]|nr:RNA polymerase sigma factor [Clostridia bacterium]
MLTKNEVEYSSERAFAESVYRIYGKKIYLLALRILKNNEEAEDCVQEVMKKIVSSTDVFISVPPENLKSLLVKCTENTAISIYRRVKRRRAHEIPLSPSGEDVVDDMSGYSSPAETLINKENKNRLNALIDDLEPRQREAVIMKYKMGIKNNDIAKMLGVSESVVNMRLYRAKKKLLKIWEDELYDIRK